MSQNTLFLAIPACIFFTLSVIFLFFPHKVVEFQGKFYRRSYKSYQRMTDEEINLTAYRWPNIRFFVGNLSEFIRYAPEQPRRFTRLINYYRICGLVLFLFLCFVGVASMCFILLEFN